MELKRGKFQHPSAGERQGVSPPSRRRSTRRADALPLALFAFILANVVSAEEMTPPRFGRPVSIAVLDDGHSVLIASQRQPSMTIINCDTMEARQIESPWPGIADAVIVPDTDSLVAVTTTPPSLFSTGTVSQILQREPVTMALRDVPAKVAVSCDHRFACVSLMWDHSVGIASLTADGHPQNNELNYVQLNFPPKELLALRDGKFLVADAFGGHLAVVDAASRTIVSQHELPGHHIGGMARSDSDGKILITHQQLSKVAESSMDDIHWGTLMRNAVSVIPEAAFLSTGEPIGKSVRTRQLGDVGNGAGDPAGIVAWGLGNFAVAVAGTDQVAVWKEAARSPEFVDAGLMPTRLVYLQPSRLLCVNTLDDTASLYDFSSGIRLEKVFGSQRTMATAEDRGEVAFFSAKQSHDGWMSCSSCHVGGHSPDLLADTMGDGRFGNPKRIPSLLNAAFTGPWGWDGSKSSLDEQIRQTLATTMHRDERSRTSRSNDQDVANDIAAWLQTRSMPAASNNITEATSIGAGIFRQRGCIKCHDPDRKYTSAQTCDVSVHDEAGTRLFNPPSLIGVKHRRAFFHDARFRSLEELLQTHPDAGTGLSPEERAGLKEFLMSL